MAPKPIKAKRRKISDYRPDPNNANTGTERGEYMLEHSIEQFGLGRSIVAADDDTIPAGNGTIEKAAEMGFTDVIEIETDGNELVVVKRKDWPTVDHEQARGYAYADNRAGEVRLQWDTEQLKRDHDAGIDLSGMFLKDELVEMGVVEQEAVADPGAQVDRAAELLEVWQVERGQVWEVPSQSVPGRCHRVMCGDSTDAGDVGRLMGGERAQGCFTSPPYAEQRKRDYEGVQADKYVEWWGGIQECTKEIIAPDGSFFLNIKPHCDDEQRSLYVMELVIAMKRRWGWRYVEEYCWKHSGSPGRVITRFKNQFEPIYHFSLNRSKIRPENVSHESRHALHGGGPSMARLQGKSDPLAGVASGPGMAYPGNVIEAGKNNEALGHPAAFPIALPDFFMRAFSDEGEIWYDPFLGSGTTLVACEQTGRIGFGMEIEPKYVAVTLQRLNDLGLSPALVSGDE